MVAKKVILYRCHDDKQVLPNKSVANSNSTAAMLIHKLLLTTTRRNGLRYFGEGLIGYLFIG